MTPRAPGNHAAGLGPRYSLERQRGDQQFLPAGLHGGAAGTDARWHRARADALGLRTEERAHRRLWGRGHGAGPRDGGAGKKVG